MFMIKAAIGIAGLWMTAKIVRNHFREEPNQNNSRSLNTEALIVNIPATNNSNHIQGGRRESNANANSLPTNTSLPLTRVNLPVPQPVTLTVQMYGPSVDSSNNTINREERSRSVAPPVFDGNSIHIPPQPKSTNTYESFRNTNQTNYNWPVNVDYAPSNVNNQDEGGEEHYNEESGKYNEEHEEDDDYSEESMEHDEKHEEGVVSAEEVGEKLEEGGDYSEESGKYDAENEEGADYSEECGEYDEEYEEGDIYEEEHEDGADYSEESGEYEEEYEEGADYSEEESGEYDEEGGEYSEEYDEDGEDYSTESEDSECEECGYTFLSDYQRKNHTCKFYGYFKCVKCRYSWQSAHAWKGKCQWCKKCGAANYPDRIERLKRNGEKATDNGKPHEERLCQRCRELGRPCYRRYRT